jgi:hypothetical protein
VHVAPAADALGAVRAHDIDGQLGAVGAGFADLGAGDDEQHVELGGALAQQGQRLAAGADDDPGLERRPDRLGLALRLQRAVDDVADRDQLGPAIDQRVVAPRLRVVRQEGEVQIPTTITYIAVCADRRASEAGPSV